MEEQTWIHNEYQIQADLDSYQIQDSSRKRIASKKSNDSIIEPNQFSATKTNWIHQTTMSKVRANPSNTPIFEISYTCDLETSHG